MWMVKVAARIIFLEAWGLKIEKINNKMIELQDNRITRQQISLTNNLSTLITAHGNLKELMWSLATASPLRTLDEIENRLIIAIFPFFQIQIKP